MLIKTERQIIEEIKAYQDLDNGFYEWIKNAKILHPSEGLISPIMYEKFREAIDALIECHFLIILKSRQVGVSTLFSLFNIWAATMFAGWCGGVISRRREDASTFLSKGTFTLPRLPRYLVPSVKSDNKLSISFGHSSKVVTSPPTKHALRGETLSLLTIDEAAACQGVREFYASSYLTLSKNFEAISSGVRRVPYGIVVISTGAELTNPSALWFYNLWCDAESRANKFYPVKVHWSDAGYTKEWKLEQEEALNHDEDMIRTELECGFISARRESMVFDPESLTMIEKRVASAKRVPFKKWKGFSNAGASK